MNTHETKKELNGMKSKSRLLELTVALSRKVIAATVAFLFALSVQAQTVDIGTVTNGSSGTGWSFTSPVLTVTGDETITGTTSTNRIHRNESCRRYAMSRIDIAYLTARCT